MNRKVLIVTILVAAVCIAGLMVGLGLLLDRSVSDPSIQSVSLLIKESYGVIDELKMTRLTIHADGQVVYEQGLAQEDRFTDVREAKADPRMMEDLFTVVRTSRFFDLPEELDEQALDAPLISISVVAKEGEHTVSGYGPTNERFNEVRDAMEAIRDSTGIAAGP